MNRKRVLLMGQPGSGKTAMKNIIFSNSLPEQTFRFGPTRGIEHSAARLLPSLVLHLLDCGDLDECLSANEPKQQHANFSNASLLLYIFDFNSMQEGDLQSFTRVMGAISLHAPQCAVVVLLNKIDCAGTREEQLSEARVRILARIPALFPNPIYVFGTSIFDHSLLEAWSRAIHLLLQSSIEAHELGVLLQRCNYVLRAKQVTLLQRQTCLVLASTGETSDATYALSQRLKTLLSSSNIAAKPQSICFASGNCLQALTENTLIYMEFDNAVRSSSSARRTLQRLAIRYEQEWNKLL